MELGNQQNKNLRWGGYEYSNKPSEISSSPGRSTQSYDLTCKEP